MISFICQWIDEANMCLCILNRFASPPIYVLHPSNVI